jgi:hypothetical protein
MLRAHSTSSCVSLPGAALPDKLNPWRRLPIDHINLAWKTIEECSRRVNDLDAAIAPTMRERGLL